MVVAPELPREAADGTNASAVAPGDRAARTRFLAVAGAVIVIWGLHNGFLFPWELRNLDAVVREPLFVVMRAVLWLVPATFFLRRHDPRDSLVALGVTSRPSWRGLGVAVVIGGVYLALVVLLLRATAEPGERAETWTTLLRLRTLYIFLNALLEELFVRGFLLGQLVRFTSSFRAQACVAVLFGLVHLPAWIGVDGLHVGLLPSLVMVTLLGAVLGAVTQLSRSILPAIVVHFVNNLLAELLA